MKKQLPKTLKDNESTYKNGAGGAMCGGVISKTRMYKDVIGNMMAYYMEDDKFEEYKKLTDEKEKRKFFHENAKSII